MVVKKNSIIMRGDVNFYDAIKKIQLQRINLGKEQVNKPIKVSRVTFAISKHKFFPKIMEDIVREFK